MPTRYAVINADDFGVSPPVNQAIMTAHTEGVLTSTSLMVTGNAVDAAVDFAQQHPRLGVGLHLVVVKGRAALPPAKIPQLVNAKGEFPNSPVVAGLRYQFNRPARQQLAQEIRAQLEAFRQTGLELSHVDGHKHLHCHPVVLGILIDLAPEFKIPVIRLPWEELRFTLDIDRQHLLEKALHWWIFGLLRQHGRPRLQAAGIGCPERVYGLLETGNMTEDYLLQLIPQIQAHCVEIYSHPTLGPSASPRQNGAGELQALLSDRLGQTLASAGFELTNFHNPQTWH